MNLSGLVNRWNLEGKTSKSLPVDPSHCFFSSPWLQFMTRPLFVALCVLLVTFRSFRALALPSLASLLSFTSGINFARSARPFEENGYLIFLSLFKLTQPVIIHRFVWSIIPSEEVFFFFSLCLTLSQCLHPEGVVLTGELSRLLLVRQHPSARLPARPDLKAASSSTFRANRRTKVLFKEERKNTINQRKTWQVDDRAGMKQCNHQDGGILVALAWQQEPGQSAPECIQIIF